MSRYPPPVSGAFGDDYPGRHSLSDPATVPGDLSSESHLAVDTDRLNGFLAEVVLVGAAISYAIGGVYARRFVSGYRPMIPTCIRGLHRTRDGQRAGLPIGAPNSSHR